jgi:hypothetical protein
LPLDDAGSGQLFGESGHFSAGVSRVSKQESPGWVSLSLPRAQKGYFELLWRAHEDSGVNAVCFLQFRTRIVRFHLQPLSRSFQRIILKSLSLNTCPFALW